MLKLKPILPRDAFDVRAFRRARDQALDTTAKWVKREFEKTTASWKDEPKFTIDSPRDNERIIGTDDERYGYVDDGTRPHVIVARGKVLRFAPGGTAKTKPRVIGSGAGSRGGVTIFRPRVQHPGTAAREFSETIGEQAEQELAKNMQRAIDGVA